MKKIVIMGASSGIGYAAAEAFLKGGIKVGLAARSEDKLRELADRYPGLAEYEKIDVTSRDASKRLHRLIKKLGGMDIYFHVSGIGYENDELVVDRECEFTETNVTGFVRCVSTAYRYFRDHGGKGQIAAITSVAGTNGIADMAAYSASKAFDSTYLTALCQHSRAHDLNIAITDIRPGWIRTPLLKKGKSYPLEMEVAEVLLSILRAIVRKRRVAVVDWRWNLLVGAWRLLPNAVWTRLKIEW